VLAKQVPDGQGGWAGWNKIALKILQEALESTMKKTSAGWALRRNLWVHDLTDPLEFFRLAPQYTLKAGSK